jgi:hypothetical protein
MMRLTLKADLLLCKSLPAAMIVVYVGGLKDVNART